MEAWKQQHQDPKAEHCTLGWLPVGDGAPNALCQGNWIPPSCRVQGGSRGAPRTSPSLPQQGVVPCPRPALSSHSHHHFASVPLHQDLPFSSCRGWWRKTPDVTWQRTKEVVFNQMHLSLTRTGRQPCFSHRNQSSTNMVGLLTRSTSRALQPFHLWQLPGRDKSGAWCRQKMEITPKKPMENQRSKQTALHRELGVFPRPYHPPQECPGIFTIPGTALVPKCHNKGKNTATRSTAANAWPTVSSAGEGKAF